MTFQFMIQRSSSDETRGSARISPSENWILPDGVPITEEESSSSLGLRYPVEGPHFALFDSKVYSTNIFSKQAEFGFKKGIEGSMSHLDRKKSVEVGGRR